MKKLIAALMLSLIIAGVFGGLAVKDVSADENYNDHSWEVSQGDGEAPDGGMNREEPRTRFKDQTVLNDCTGDCDATSSESSQSVVAITEDERYWLTYLREEEKLARDVYIYLNDLWDMRIFKNIAASEQKHMDQ